MSFLLFMVGLSGLMRVLLSHSPYYLAGGFIGGMWQTYLGESLGQFAALLLAMVCTALGFYFCSGQTVIPLLTSFYEWLTVKDAPKITNAEVTENNDSHLAETDTPFTSMPSVSTEQAADEIPELSSSPALTDVSVFRRPNITGLASTQPQTVNAEQDFPLHSEHVMTNLTDPAMFKVESEVELPKVNVQGFTPDSLPTMEDTPTLSQADEVYEPFDVSLPTVKLANYAEGDEASETSATSETFEVEVEAEPSHEMSISLIDQEVKTPAFIQESSPLSTRPVVRMKPFEEVAIQPETEEKDELDNVGKPLAGREIRLVENEIWVKGNCLALGYWQKNGEIRPLTNEQGWLQTKDLGCWNEKGHLIIKGRLDNMFISGGENIQPEEVEKVLFASGLLRQIFIVPIADVEFGERPVAVVDLLEPFSTQAVEKLQNFATQHLERFKYPICYLPLDENLQQGGIKISRQKLKAEVAVKLGLTCKDNL